MVPALGASSPTLQPSEDLKHIHLDLEDLDATILLTAAEALLVEELDPLSPMNISDDQDVGGLTLNDNTEKPHQASGPSKRQTYRRMQKREREELRRQAIELQEELARVRRAKEVEKAQFNAAQKPTFWLWKSVATRQQHECFLAKEEQRALTMSAHVQATYIRTLTKVMRIPEEKSLFLTGQVQAVSGHKKQRCGVLETELFDALIQDLDSNCEHVEELFQTCRSKPQFKVRMPDGTLDYSQLYITETIPFSLSQTSHFLWKYGTGHHSDNPDYKRCVDVRDPENTSARSFRNAITLENGVKVSLRNRLVTRRYNKGHIAAWKLVSGGEGVHNGFQFDETAWVSLRASEAGTVIEMCIRRTPIHFTTTAILRDREPFEQALHQQHDKARDDILTSLQSVLIDDVLPHLPVLRLWLIHAPHTGILEVHVFGMHLNLSCAMFTTT